MKASILQYFKGSFVVTFFGLLASFFIGEYYLGNASGGLKYLALALILAVLEVSISFDNAVVNATVLKEMSDLWVKRFLTWGMLIAVFGMRLVFPLVIVAMVGGVGLWEALKMAAIEPDKYAHLMTSIHHEVSAFGGAFLLLVALKFFIDVNKEVHWISIIEKRLSKLGQLESIEIGITLIVIYLVSHFVEADHKVSILIAGIGGVITYIGVEALGELLQAPDSKGMSDLHKASLGMFLYLEVVDASFSFDGVIGAFAITNNLFIIAIGLGIGAMFVRSLTIMMVERGTLNAYRFLEHGAFWAVTSLAVIMFLNTIYEIPEIITGVIGAGFIGLSVLSSLKPNRPAVRS